MCKISPLLQLCTCNSNAASLQHYWIFYRFDKNKKNYIIGEILLPTGMNAEDDTFNKSLLLQVLNNGNVFDTNIAPAAKDRLLLCFTVTINRLQQTAYYGFRFTNKQWKACDYDPLEWEWRHNEEKKGKIKNALQHGEKE